VWWMVTQAPVYCICDNQFEGGSSWLAVSVGF
jgi:hypothetical protein